MRFFNHRRHGHIIGSVYLVHFARAVVRLYWLL